MADEGTALMDVKINEYRDDQFLRLYKWNLIAGILHLIQSIIQLILVISVDNFNEFRIPIYSYYWIPDRDSEGNVVNLVINQDQLSLSRIGFLVWIFFLLSAAFHFIIISPIYWDVYKYQINNGRNYLRWIEYSISSTLMILYVHIHIYFIFCVWILISYIVFDIRRIIVLLFGGLDIGLLITVGLSNATMNLLGLFQEKYNKIRDITWNVDWLPFNLGCLIGFGPWIVVIIKIIGSQINDGDSLPGFVWGVLIGYFIFFNTFPINMFLQYKKISYWKDYLFGEWCYILLSLASKTLLGWLVFGGLNQPNDYSQ